jgi:hypothetical protein
MLLSPVVLKWMVKRVVKSVGTHQTTNGTARANARAADGSHVEQGIMVHPA